MLIQYLIGPKMVEWQMGVRYVTEQEYPALIEWYQNLQEMQGSQTKDRNWQGCLYPMHLHSGRWAKDGRICVTEGILNLLNEKETQGGPGP